MVFKGVVSTVNEATRKARVYIPNKNYLSPEILISSQLALQPNDNVVVAFFGNTMTEGIILEKL